MKASTPLTIAILLTSVNVSAEGTETHCPEIADIQYDSSIELYQAVLPGTDLQLQSKPDENVGTIESFDSVFIDDSNGSLTYCVYRLGNEDPVVLWPAHQILAEQNGSNLWMPFINYHYCTQSPSACKFDVQD